MVASFETVLRFVPEFSSKSRGMIGGAIVVCSVGYRRNKFTKSMNSQKQRLAVSRVGRANRAERRGIFNPNYDRAQQSSVIGTRMRDEKKGLFSASRDKSEGGRKTAEIHRARGTGVFNPKMGAFGLHVQWHINRGVYNQNCAFCIAGVTSFEEVN
jgi:hypothetical protein